MDTVSRRTALGMISAGSAAAAGWPGTGFATPVRPWLGNDDQIAAERMLLELLKDPEIARIQARLKADLAASPRATTLPDAAARLDGAIAQWTNSLILAEINKRPAPFFVWATEDSPRTWFGHTVGGVGTSGDNPDAIYRIAAIAGGGRYEITGRYHPNGKPTQLLIELNAGDKARPGGLMPPTARGAAHQDIHSASQLSDQQIVPGKDGWFWITVGGPPKSFNHLTVPPSGPCMIGVRDMLSDWNQRPAQLSIRRLDTIPAEPWDIEVVRRRVHEDLDGYIRYWSAFPDKWFGGLKPNARSAPMARPGGWGFVAGLNFSLAPDEALVVVTDPGGARYTGFQINDPWMIAPDARTRQVCLNTSQTMLNPDGSATFVIAASDPGAANWLDTAGMRDGLAIIRWQAVPPDLKGDGLIREFRVVKLGEAAAMPGPRVTPAERAARIAARTKAYNTRVR